MKTKKIIFISLLLIIVLSGVWALWYNFYKSSSEITQYKTTSPFTTDIKKTAIATGEVKPRETIEIKPNITGIIYQILVKEGEEVTNGQLIASIKVIPDVNSLNNAQMNINSSKIELENQSRNYQRQKKLFDQGVISRAEYETALATYNSAKQNLQNAYNNYQVAQSGVAPGLEQYSTTQIRSTINGLILDIPVETGDNVQEISNFSTGTTIATIANIKDMIFEGKVDEAEVGKLKEGMPIEVKIGALPGEIYHGTLDFISPSGKAENGVVEFEIKASIDTSSNSFLRAGYSANAEVTTENRKNVLALKESEIQYDDEGKPFVEVKMGEKFEKRYIRLGVSDGINVEILKGLKKSDQVKIWNTDLKTDGKEK